MQERTFPFFPSFPTEIYAIESMKSYDMAYENVKEKKRKSTNKSVDTDEIEIKLEWLDCI